MEEKFNILVVDDEEMICQAVTAYFTANGYTVFTADSGKRLLMYLTPKNRLCHFRLNATGNDREEVCEHLRTVSSVPVLMLTAKTGDDDIVNGLNIGADDYMTKPFSMKQLLARVEAISRRFSNSNKPLAKVFKYDDLVVDCSKMEVFLNGKFISVTPIEWRILSSMIQNQRKVYTRDELLTIAFGTDYDGFDRSVDTHIKNLRKKLGDDPRKSTYIHTVHGIGYRFGGEV
ncbi:MAG: response regulator transcription factor [Muribaculaceae bacterium]